MTQSNGPATTPQQCWRQAAAGRAALFAGRTAEALACFADLPALAPSARLAASSRRWLAEALLAAGRFGEGIAMAERALGEAQAAGSSVRSMIEAWTTLGLARSLAGTAEPASDAFAQADALSSRAGRRPGLAEIRLHCFVVRLLSGAGQLEEAGNVLERAKVQLCDATPGGLRLAMMLANEQAVLALRTGSLQSAAQSFADLASLTGSLFGAGHPQRLTALHNQAIALRRSSSRTDALPLLADVVALRLSALGSGHPDTLISRSFLALQRVEAGHGAEPLDELRAVLAETRRVLTDRHLCVFQIAGRLAAATALAGDPAGSLAILEEWAARANDTLGPTHPEAGSLLHEYAGALRNAGRLAEARDVYTQLAEATRRDKGPDDTDTLASYNNLAVVMSDLGDVEGAERVYRMMLEAFGRLGVHHALNRASVQNNLAHLLLGRDRAAEARTLFQAVLDVRMRRLEPTNRLVLLSRGNLASALAKEGRREEALEQHRRNLQDRRDLFGPNHPDTLASLHNVGSTLEELGRQVEALPLLREVAEARRDVLGAEHHDTIVSLRALAGALIAAGERQEAIAIYTGIVETIETVRRADALPDELLRSQFAQYVPIYRRLARLLVDGGDVEAVFALAERIKARTILGKLSARGWSRERLLEPADLEARRSIERRIAGLERAMSNASDAVTRNALTIQRDAARREWRELDGRLRAASPAFARASEAQAPSLSAASEMLEAGECYASFLVHGDEIVAVFVTAEQAKAIVLGVIPSLASGIEAFVAQLADPRSQASGGEMGRGLSRVLADGLPDFAVAGSRLIVSPDGPLAALPFEPLERHGASLLSLVDISYVSSLAVGFAPHESGPDPDGERIPLIAIGNPPDGGDGRWPELPGTAKELQLVGELFGLVDDTTLFRREAANLGAIRMLERAGALGRATLILFSAHGFLDTREPLRSAIILAPDPQAPEAGGALTAGEIASYRLDADVVVLSACNTGAGTFQPGEGIMGLPFALRVAGARRTVQTLWPVFDAQSATFSVRFFTHLSRGVASSAALAQAKRDAARGLLGSSIQHPCYWAAFLLYGR